MKENFSLRKIILFVALVIMNTPLVKIVIYSFPPSDNYKEDYVSHFTENLFYVGIVFMFLFNYLGFFAKDYKNRLRDILLIISNLGFILLLSFNYPILSISGLLLVLFSMGSLVLLKLKDLRGDKSAPDGA